MVVEAPIDVSRLPAPLARFGVRVMHIPFGRVGLWAHVQALRQHFDNTDHKYDNHVHLVAIEGAANILECLKIRHPDKSEGRSVWRSFFSRIVVAADDPDINKARAVMSNKAVFLRAAEEEDIWLNPGNGNLLVRFIMKRTSTTQEIQRLYDNFKKAPNRTSEIDVFAAYSVKMQRFLTASGADEELKPEWLRNQFDTEVAAIVNNPEEFTFIIKKLEEEYPDDEG